MQLNVTSEALQFPTALVQPEEDDMFDFYIINVHNEPRCPAESLGRLWLWYNVSSLATLGSATKRGL